MFIRKGMLLLIAKGCLLKFLSYANCHNDYAGLQSIETMLKGMLDKVLEIKKRVAEDFVKKDLDLNKELLARLQQQHQQNTMGGKLADPQQKPPTTPRFRTN